MIRFPIEALFFRVAEKNTIEIATRDYFRPSQGVPLWMPNPFNIYWLGLIA